MTNGKPLENAKNSVPGRSALLKRVNAIRDKVGDSPPNGAREIDQLNSEILDLSRLLNRGIAYSPMALILNK